jgi:hypothetical protein
MGLRAISVGTGFEDGVNFRGCCEPQMVAEVLEKLYYELNEGGQPCYCLQLRVGPQEAAHFRPLGPVLCPGGAAQAPARVALEWLVPDSLNWPVLAVGEWMSEPERAKQLGLTIGGVHYPLQWHAQMRIQRGREYVGYLKVAAPQGLGRPIPPDDRVLLDAYYSTKLYLGSLLSERAVERTQTSCGFRDRLRTTRRSIADLRGSNLRLALKHVADMLTSHLGAGWNRAACYCPVERDTLRCLWAQGGDGTHRWCERIQRPLGESVRDVGALVEEAHRHKLPEDDAYTSVAAGQWPVQLRNVWNHSNRCAVAQLWRSNGTISDLPDRFWAWELCSRPMAHMANIDRHSLSCGGALAVVFDSDDPWVDATIHERPTEPIFCSLNGRYWALPWLLNDELIAIWVVDMCYWGAIDENAEGFPSFALSNQILGALAQEFEVASKSRWATDSV